MARDSFSLTLYTVWHLQQLEAHDHFSDSLRQHDLASLVSFAFNDPKQLPELRARYVAQFTPPLTERERTANEVRVLRLMQDHQHLTPIDPPDPETPE